MAIDSTPSNLQCDLQASARDFARDVLGGVAEAIAPFSKTAATWASGAVSCATCSSTRATTPSLPLREGRWRFSLRSNGN